MARQLGFAIIGCGLVAPFHARAMAAWPDTGLVAVADLDFTHAERLAREYGGAAFNDYRRVPDRSDVDVVCICTPNGTREEIAVRAAEAGKHLFECIPRRATFRNGYIGLFWASYIDQPETLDIHFIGQPQGNSKPNWIRSGTPSHGEQATHLASTDHRQFAHDAAFPLKLVFGFSTHRYSEPWYFGLARGMAFAQMFRPADGVRLSQSPSGGGRGNPAWDFQWFIEQPRVDERYQLVMRAAYLPVEENKNARVQVAQAIKRVRRFSK